MSRIMSTPKLRQARSTAKALVTKAKGDIESALLRGEKDISSEVKRLKDKLDNFKQIHEDYLKHVTDCESIHHAKLYYEEVVMGVQELLDKETQSVQEVHNTNPTGNLVAQLNARKKLMKKKFQLEQDERQLAHRREMLELESKIVEAGGQISAGDEHESEPLIPSEAGSSSAILQQQKQLIDLLTAPKLEVPTFDGSPMQYFPFIKAFEDNVERVVTEHSSRLTRLIQYCTGSAKRLIQCCAMMPSSEGYLRARELLRDRFGNAFTVTTAFIDHVTTGNMINDVGLRTYSDELRNGYEMLRAMSCLAEINVQSNLLKIVSRLPNYIQNRWRHEATRIKREQNKLPCFLDIVNMVEEAAEEANDPVFGSVLRPHTINKQMSSSSSDKPRRALNFTSVITPAGRSLKCFYCTQDHSIYVCENFKGLTSAERIRATQEKKLCSNCLRAGVPSVLSFGEDKSLVVDKVLTGVNKVELKGAPNSYDATTLTGTFANFNATEMSVSAGEEYIPETKQNGSVYAKWLSRLFLFENDCDGLELKLSACFYNTT